MDRAVHQEFLKEVHAQYTKDQGFIDLVSLPWSDECFRPDQLYQFIKNFDAAKETTMVDGHVILLDKDILAMIFRLPKGQHKRC